MSEAPPKPSVGMMLANLAATLPSTLTSAVLEQVRLAGVEQGKAEHRAEFLIEQHERAVQQAVAEATAELRETVAALSEKNEGLSAALRDTQLAQSSNQGGALLAKNSPGPALLDQAQDEADRLYKLAQDPIATYGALSPKVKGLKPSDVANWTPPRRMDALRWAMTPRPPGGQDPERPDFLANLGIGG